MLQTLVVSGRKPVSSAVREQLATGVQHICSTDLAFAAVKGDGVVAW